jgi:hypothetical protein
MPALSPATKKVRDRLVRLLRLQKDISDGNAGDLGRRQTHVLVEVLRDAITPDMPELEQTQDTQSTHVRTIKEEAIGLQSDLRTHNS